MNEINKIGWTGLYLMSMEHKGDGNDTARPTI